MVEGNLVAQVPGTGPQAIWPGYTDTTSIDFGWWGPLSGTVDHYRVYQAVAPATPSLLYGTLSPWTSGAPTGVVPDGIMGNGGHPLPWYTSISLTPGTTYNFAVTWVDGLGNESVQSPILTASTLPNGSSTPPAPPVSPDTWIQPYALPTGTVWTISATAAPTAAGTGTNNATGCGSAYAFAHSNINGGDVIVFPSAAATTVANAGITLPVYTGTNGWTYVISDQDPGYNASGFLEPYSVVKSNFGLTVLSFTAAPASGATSAVLAPNQANLTDATGKWLLRGGYFYISFPDGEERLCNFARGSTTVSWTTYNSGLYANGAGLANTQSSATCLLAGPDGVTGVHNYVNPSDPSFAMSTINFGAANGPCFRIPPVCNKVRFVGLAMIPTRGLASNNTVFEAVIFGVSTYGNIQTPVESIYFDRCLWGDDLTATGSSAILHAIYANCNHFLVHQCYFWGTMTYSPNSGADSNGVLVGGGQYQCLRNSYFSAGSESWLWGGVYVAQNQIPQDISIQYNMSHKPLGWAPANAVPAFRTNYTKNVKNLGEFKVGQRVEIFGNLFLNCWTDQAAGYHGAGCALGCRDQTISIASVDAATNPWNILNDVYAHDNQLYNVQSAFISFTSDGTTGLDTRIKIYNNIGWLSTVNPISADPLEGVRLTGPCTDHIIDHNTFIPNTAVAATIGNLGVRNIYNVALGTVSGGYGNPQPYTQNAYHAYQDRMTVTNNAVGGNTTSAGLAFHQDSGVPTLATFPNVIFSKNITFNDTFNYGSGTLANVAYSGAGFANFVNDSSIPLHPSDWNIVSGPYATASTTGGPIGAFYGAQSASQVVNWGPGQYLQFGENDTAASRVNTINSLPANTGGLVGVVDVWTWGHLDNGTSGPNYQFADPNSVIAACKAKGLKYILDTASRAFGGASYTGIIPQWIINNGWTYTRPAGPAAGGASVWVPACMTAKTNLELAFVNQSGFMATYVTGTTPTMMAWSSDESVIGTSLTTTQTYSVSALVNAEIQQRWQVLRAQVPQLAVILYTNYLTGDTTGSPNMQTLFTTAANLGGILINGGPDCFAQNVPGTNETPGQQCCDGQIGGVNYTGTSYGMLGGVQNAENTTTTYAQVFAAFNTHFQAQYQQWYESPSWGGGSMASLLTFLEGNPVTNTAYPSTWPKSTQQATPVFNYSSFNASNTNQTTSIVSGNFVVVGSNSALSGSSINIFNGGAHSGGKAWYGNQVDVSGGFTTDFNMTPPQPGQIGGTAPTDAAIGIVFCVQTSNSTTDPSPVPTYGVQAGGDANLVGFGAFWWPTSPMQSAICNSVAIKFDLQSGNAIQWVPLSAGGQANPNNIALLVSAGPSDNMQPSMDLNPSGINFYNGNPLAVHIVYDGSLITMTMKDTVTNKQMRVSWPFIVQNVIGGNSGWVGFAGGKADKGSQVTTGPCTWLLNSWSFSKSYNTRLALPTFSVLAGQYATTQNVTISAPSGASIYYTINGRQPTTSDTLYAAPVAISSSTFLQAIAVQNGFTDSLVASANYRIQSSGPTINFPSGFTSAANLLSIVGCASINGSALQLVLSQASQPNISGYVGCAWYASPVNITGVWSTAFTFQYPSGGNNMQAGLTFCIQNQPPASDFSYNNAAPVWNDGLLRWSAGGPLFMGVGTGFGYAGSNSSTPSGTPNVPQYVGPTRSVAIKFDAGNNTTGLYQNGQNILVGSGGTPTGLAFVGAAHQFQVTVSYDGANLSWTIKDLTTSTTFSSGNQAVNIASVVNGSTAYVGFTAGSYFGTQVEILNWTGF